MCFALYKVKKNQATNETPMQGTRTGCIANVKKRAVGTWSTALCGVCGGVVYALIIFRPVKRF